MISDAVRFSVLIFVPLSMAFICSAAVKAKGLNPESRVDTLAIVGMAFCESVILFAIIFK